jgi:hypothetical protein
MREDPRGYRVRIMPLGSCVTLKCPVSNLDQIVGLETEPLDWSSYCTILISLLNAIGIIRSLVVRAFPTLWILALVVVCFSPILSCNIKYVSFFVFCLTHKENKLQSFSVLTKLYKLWLTSSTCCGTLHNIATPNLMLRAPSVDHSK